MGVGTLLFVYAITGFVLLPFIRIRAKTAFRWAAALLGAITVAGLAFTSLLAAVDDPDDPVTIAMEQFFADRHTQLIDAMAAGGYGDVIVAHAWESLVIQGSQLLTLPWILALFLAGVGVARTGIIADPVRFRRPLRIAATVGLVVGLPLNLIVGAAGPAAMGSAFAPDPGSLVSSMVLVAAMALGAPLLAIGYLAALALLFLRARTPGPLVAIGRTALSAYLVQNAIALTVFAGCGLYERLPEPGRWQSSRQSGRSCSSPAPGGCATTATGQPNGSGEPPSTAAAHDSWTRTGRDNRSRHDRLRRR